MNKNTKKCNKCGRIVGKKGHICPKKAWNKGIGKRFFCVLCNKKAPYGNKYCGNECYRKHNTGENHPCYKRVRNVCKYCEKMFETEPSKRKKFCGMDCYQDWKRYKRIEYKREGSCLITTNCVLDKDGYPKVTRFGSNYRLGRWLWEEKKGKIPGGMLLLHKCDNPRCVELEHLHVGTAQDNSNDAVKRGRVVRGEEQHLSKLDDKSVRIVRSMLNKKTDAEIAKRFGVNPGTIWHIRRGITWRYV